MLEKGETEACAYWLPESLGAAARWLLPGAGAGRDGAQLSAQLCAVLRQRAGRGSASVQGCASSPWPDSRWLHTYSREARCKKLIQPIAPVLPGEQLEGRGGGGNSLLLPGPLHQPFGGKTQPARALCWHGCSPAPPQSLLGPMGFSRLGKAPLPPGCPPEHFTHGEHSTKTSSGESGGEYVIGLPSCPSYPLPKLKHFLAALP